MFPDFGLQLTFPNSDAMPAHACLLVLFFLVTGLVAFYLRLPEVGTAIGNFEVTAIFMPVPETSIDEDDCAVLAHHDVGTPRQPRMVQSVPESMGKQVATHQEFGLGALAVYGSHTPTALFLRHLVHRTP